ncbi:hypothetical protein [Fastidiosibacter lacustris]|uniref:hypothetical protein n=1 Tax=Fastidiosibacter lacustris TaxID=2056695 RepID=UPI000E340DBF|nr:hypothetical protein [Fastidiosibacter lacustris]
MNDKQKERLLKIAETHPELAKEMAKEMIDIFKTEKSNNQEPIAVKMVKSEDDKIEITPEQKKYAIFAVIAIAIAVVSIFLHVFNFITNIHTISFEEAKTAFITTGITFFICIASFWFCAYKASFPVIKQFMMKHFR